MDSKKLYEIKKNELEIIEAFDEYTLYYDRKEKTLWVWNDEDFIGMYTDDLYEFLMEII